MWQYLPEVTAKGALETEFMINPFNKDALCVTNQEILYMHMYSEKSICTWKLSFAESRKDKVCIHRLPKTTIPFNLA